MGSKPYNNFDYDAYYDWKESTNKSAYFHDGNKKDEYVDYEHENGEYILERKPQNKQSNSEDNKPKHISSDPGVYDELDYNLSPRNETHNFNQTVLKDLDKKDGRSKQRTVVIILVVAFLILVAVCVSVLLAINGKFWYKYKLFE